jgi:hypothetical protein
MPVTKRVRPKADSTVIKELQEQIKKLESSKASEESWRVRLASEREILEREIESVHGALDQIPHCPERTVKTTNQYGSETTTKLTIDARLFGWLANRA